MFKNFQGLFVEVTAEFRQAGMVKVSHLEAGFKGGACFRQARGHVVSVRVGLVNPPLSALRGFLAAARLSCYCPTISKMLHESHLSNSC